MDSSYYGFESSNSSSLKTNNSNFINQNIRNNSNGSTRRNSFQKLQKQNSFNSIRNENINANENDTQEGEQNEIQNSIYYDDFSFENIYSNNVADYTTKKQIGKKISKQSEKIQATEKEKIRLRELEREKNEVFNDLLKGMYSNGETLDEEYRICEKILQEQEEKNVIPSGNSRFYGSVKKTENETTGGGVTNDSHVSYGQYNCFSACIDDIDNFYYEEDPAKKRLEMKERREILYENDILEHDIMCDKIVKTLSMTNVCLSPKNMGEEEKNEYEKGLGLRTGEGKGDKIFKKMQIDENNKINSNHTENSEKEKGKEKESFFNDELKSTDNEETEKDRNNKMGFFREKELNRNEKEGKDKEDESREKSSVESESMDTEVENETENENEECSTKEDDDQSISGKGCFHKKMVTQCFKN